MALKARCPKNPEHKTFTTVAHIMQEWVVDENGDFVETYDPCLEVTHKPTKGNIWACNECDAIAIVEEK